jgi:hypothetical protein
VSFHDTPDFSATGDFASERKTEIDSALAQSEKSITEIMSALSRAAESLRAGVAHAAWWEVRHAQ